MIHEGINATPSLAGKRWSGLTCPDYSEGEGGGDPSSDYPHCHTRGATKTATSVHMIHDRVMAHVALVYTT